MKTLRSACLPLLALSALFATAGCAADTSEPASEPVASTRQELLIGGTIGAVDLKVNRADFEAAMHTQLSRSDYNLMGYSFALVKGGQLVAEGAGGLARADQDGRMNMTVNIPINIGSTQKLISMVTLLGIMERKLPGSNSNHTKTVDEQLDSEMIQWLPAKWQAAAGSGVDTITFRELLMHKSGFRMKGDLTPTPTNFPANPYIFDYLNLGTGDATKDRVYANMNAAILTQLIPFYANTTDLWLFNNSAKFFVPGSKTFRLLYAPYFESYMKENVFAKTTPPINPSCDEAVEYGAIGRPFALHYVNGSDGTKGLDTSEKRNNDSCQAQGGYVYSARELAAWVATFAGTEKFVSASLRARMYTQADNDNRLGWQFRHMNSKVGGRFGVSVPFAGGDTSRYHATIAELPGNYYALAIVNSDFSSVPPGSTGSNELTRALATSWSDALEN